MPYASWKFMPIVLITGLIAVALPASTFADVAVDPAEPKCLEEVFVVVTEDFSQDCFWTVDSYETFTIGDTIYVDMVLDCGFVCLQVLTTKAFTVSLGELPAGDYDVEVTWDTTFFCSASLDGGSTSFTVDSCSGYQEGVNDYEGTLDVSISEDTADTTDDSSTVTIANSVSDGEIQGLIRFDDIFGSDDDQIPTGSFIESARLILNVEDATDEIETGFHRMLVDWDEESTWDSLDDGVSTDDVEAATTPEATILPTLEEQIVVDVTATVQAWSDGDDCFGWCLVATGTSSDEWNFSSSEAVTEGNRPILEITALDVGFMRGDVNADGSVFAIIDAVALLEWGFQNGPEPVCEDAADFDDNGTVFPILDAIALLNWAFNGADPPPAPEPGDCGDDETADDLECDEPTCVIE